MKKAFRKAISILLVAVMVFGAAPLAGFIGLDLPKINLFSTKAEAAKDGYYTYSVSNGEATITDVDTSISGDIVIPSTLGGYPVTGIGQMAFYYLKSLESVTIPNGVTEIGEYAFSGCYSLKGITIPKSVTSIGKCAFRACDYMKNITVDSGNTAYSSDKNGVLFNKDKTVLIHYPMGSSVKSYTIPDGVTSIGDYAFCDCDGFTSVTIPDSVTSIGNSAFYDCSSLAEAYYKGTLEQWVSISGASDNVSLTGKVVCECDSDKPYYGGTCGENLFWKIYVGGRELIISGTGEMEHYAEHKQDAWHIYGAPWRRHASSLSSVTISDGVTSIGNCAFYDYENLVKVALGNSVTAIGYSAFDGCTSLESVTIPDSVTTIGERAFENCINAEKITIGKSVTSIGYAAFSQCRGVKSITVDPANTAYTSDKNGVLFNKDKTVLVQYPMGSLTKSYSIPDGVITIGANAFHGLYGIDNRAYFLKSVTIPDSVTTIGDYAFYCCMGLSITIPDSVTTIGRKAFWLCSGLKSVKIGEGITTLEPETFYMCLSLKNVTFSRNMEFIKAGAFEFCSNIKNVYYGGAESDWAQVIIGGNNGSLSTAKVRYNSTGPAIGGSSTDVPNNTPDYDSSVVDASTVKTPTETTISYGDSIVLHVDPAKIPEGGKVEWYPSNGNFSYSVSADGTTCTITPNKSGDTTFTAIVYDADGNIVSADKQTMTSKAGFFDKLIAFFKKLFGLTKTIPEAITDI